MTYAINQAFFSTWTPEMAYVFGFWFADGWMGQPHGDLQIGFVSKDREHLRLIQSVMGSEHRLCARQGNCYTFRIGNKQMWDDLHKLGGIPAKSLVAEMPFIPKEYRRHFTRGYIDGDGTVRWDTSTRRRPHVSMVGGSLFLHQVAQMLEEETGVGVARVKIYGSKTPEIVYTGIKAMTLAKWLYSNTSLALERKAKVAHEFETWELSKFGWKSQAVMTPKMQAILTGEII
jgi:hypothetical protein